MKKTYHLLQNASRASLGGALFMAFVAGGCATPALAQDTSAPASDAAEADDGLNVITVTAQRREQSMDKVPISVTAISADALEQMNVVDSTDIVKVVPGLKFNSFSSANVVYNLRGISQNDFTDHLEPPVAVYQDDSYMSSMMTAGFPLFDIQRVEVLRGPQGTLFGRNATGGLIQYISEKPDYAFSGHAAGTIYTDGGYTLEAAAGGGVTDNLAARFALFRNQRDGYVKDLSGTGDHGEADQIAGRVQLMWEPTSDLKVSLKAQRAVDDHAVAGGGYIYAQSVPGEYGLGMTPDPTVDYWGFGPGLDINGYAKPESMGFYENETNDKSDFYRRLTDFTGKVEWTFGDVTMISITDYQKAYKTYSEDCDGSPYSTCAVSINSQARQISQEVRFEGETGGLTWQAGANYFDIDGDYATSPHYSLYGGYYDYVGDLQYSVRTKSASVFGQGTYALTDKLNLTLGGRYTYDQKTMDYVLNGTEVLGGDTTLYNYVFNTSLYPDLARRKDNLWSGKVQLDYTFTPGTMVYAGVTRGTKGGSFAAPNYPPVVYEVLSYKPETLWDYEAGIKTRLLNNHLMVNASVYYYDYQNYQAFAIKNFIQSITNLQAKAYGGELEVTAKPVYGLTLSGSVAYSHSKVKDVTLPDGVTTMDRDLPQAPRFSGNASIAYTVPVGEAEVTGRLDGTFTEHFCFTVLCNPTERQPGYALLDGSLSVKLGDFTLTGFIKNITNKKYRVYSLDANSISVMNSIWNRPRYGGATLSVDF